MHLAFPDKFLNLALEMEASDDNTGDNRDNESGDNVDQRNLPPEHGEKHGGCDLIDER